MRRITEGEVQCLIRRFLLENGFGLYTKTIKGEPLHYRIAFTNPPRFKRPDHVAIRRNAVLIFEDKVKYADLFRGKCSDLEKISSFLNNVQAMSEFRKLLGNVEPPPRDPLIVGALASFLPNKSSRTIPESYVYLGIKEGVDGFLVELCQDASLKRLFERSLCKISFSEV